ncbi:coiled-coil domain-containing protein 127-like [Astyanax mexicanus]|uniref:Coiled-coil domain-containing protein 127-like n=1 Tax=Astyanax mexicanus TaxID=7994 RepID=A0A8T2MPD9_ASTMX|nr:coiled-coil domain-containing protein 127-like [Astyanax mexicanus]
MNDLNNPNRRPEGADRGAFYYGLLGSAALLGIAGLRWLWKQDAQRQIQVMTTQTTERLSRQEQEVMKLKEEKWCMWQELLSAQEEGKKFHKGAVAALTTIEAELVHRQGIYCSFTAQRDHRQPIEEKLLSKVDTDPYLAKLVSKEDLREIFKDGYCERPWNTVDKKNGKLMWIFLKEWEHKITQQKHNKIEEVLKQFKPNDSHINN